MVDNTNPDQAPDVQTPTDSVSPADVARTKQSLGDTPITITRSMIGGATDDELQKLNTDLSSGPNANSQVAQFVSDEVQKRQQPAKTLSLLQPIQDNTQKPVIPKSIIPKGQPTISVPQPTAMPASYSYVVSSIKGDQATAPPTSQDYANIVDQDKNSQVAANMDLARTHILDNNQEPDVRLTNAQAAMNKKPVVHTLGDLWVAQNFPKLDPATSQQIAQGTDLTTRTDENNNLQAQIATGDNTKSWKDWIEEKFAVPVSVKDLISTASTGRSDLLTNAETSQPQDQANIQVISKNDDALMNFVSRGKFENVKDFVQYINPVPYDDGMQIHGWQALGNYLRYGTITDQFDKEMTSNYGPEWPIRWAAWMVKDIGVDAATIALSARNPRMAESLFPQGEVINGVQQAVPLASRLRAAVLRGMVGATGGASVQHVMDQVSGDNTNFVDQWIQRFAGWEFGEAAFKGITSIGKYVDNKILAHATDYIAQRYNLNVMRPDMANSLRDATGYKSPVAALTARAATHAYSKEFMDLSERITADIAAGLDTNANVYARRNTILNAVSDLTGIPAERLPIDLAFGTRIYKQNTFEHIGEAPEYIQARKELADHTPVFEGTQADLADVEQRLAKAQKRYDNVPVTTAKGQAQREARLASLQQELQDKTAARDEAATKFNELTNKVKEGNKLLLTTGNPFIDAIIQSDAYGFRLMGDITRRQSANQDMFLTYLSDNAMQWRPFNMADRNYGTIGLTKNKLNPFYYTGQAKAAVANFGRVGEALDFREPDTMQWGELAKDYFDAINQSLKTSQILGKMMHNSVKGIGQDGERNVWAAIMEGAERGTVFSRDELLSRGLSFDDMDAYYSVRQILDFAHTINNDNLLREWNLKGIKSYKGTPVNVIRDADSILTPARIKEGYVRIHEVQNTGSRVPIDMLVKESELEDPKSALPFIKGYVPIVYKNANYHTSIINMKNGTVRRVGAFKDLGEAMNHARMIESNGGLGEGEAVVFNNWNSVTGTGSVGFSKGGLKMFQLGTDESVQAIKSAFQNAGIDDDRVRVIMDKLDLTDMRRRFFGQRAETRLMGPNNQPAEMLPSKEAVAEYLNATAHLNGVGQWRTHAIDSFVNGFDQSIFNKQLPWYAKDFIRPDKALPIELANQVHQAREMQDWLEQIITNKTDFEKSFDNIIRALTYKYVAMDKDIPWVTGTAGAQAQVGTNPGMRYVERPAWDFSTTRKAMAQVLQNMPAMSTLIREGRGVVVKAKLLGINVGQLIIQGAQAAVTAGAEREFAVQGLQDLLKVTGARAAEMAGARPTREGQQLLYALRKSGYVNFVDYTDLMDILATPKKKWQNNLQFISGLPFTTGEAFNRLTAFLSVRRDMMDQLGRGVLKGLDNQPFRGAIDSDEFIRLVTDKAKVLALNMGKAGQLEATKGLGSLLLQFWQVVPKMGHIFETDTLSAGEKLGVAATLTGLFGVQGLPYLYDFFNIADWGINKVNELREDATPSTLEYFTDIGIKTRDAMYDYLAKTDPALLETLGIDKEFVRRLVSKGSISALSDGEIDIANRAAVGSYITQMAQSDSLEDHILAFQVFSSLNQAVRRSGLYNLMNVPVYLHILYEMHRTNKSFDEVWKQIQPDAGFIEEAIRGDRTAANAAISTANEFGRSWSYLGYLTRFVQNYDKQAFEPGLRTGDPTAPNYITTSGYQNVPVKATSGRLASYIAGIVPGKVVEEMDARQELQKYKDAKDEFINQQIKKARTHMDDPVARAAIMHDTMQEVEQFPQLMASHGVHVIQTSNELQQIMARFVKDEVYSKFPTKTYQAPK